ncbi:MAG: hypothetical protein AB7U95_26615 [Reyranella sp.]
MGRHSTTTTHEQSNSTPRRLGDGACRQFQTGCALVFNGEIKASHPSAYVLGAYLDARLKGADTRDAWIIVKAVAERGWPTLEERM